MMEVWDRLWDSQELCHPATPSLMWQMIIHQPQQEQGSVFCSVGAANLDAWGKKTDIMQHLGSTFNMK